MKYVIVAAAVVAATVSSAMAVSLLPGTSLNNPALPDALPDYTVGLPGYFTGANLVTTLVSVYSLPGDDFTGTVTSTVYRDPGDLTLGFQYVYTNATPAGAGTRDLVRATIGDVSSPWKGFGISDAGSDASGTSTVGGGTTVWTDGKPNFILRDPTVSGEGITFQWRAVSEGTVLRNPTDFSARMWVDTDATIWQETDTDVLDSGLSAEARALAPAVIPEPVTMGLFGLAVAGLGGYIRRRRTV